MGSKVKRKANDSGRERERPGYTAKGSRANCIYNPSRTGIRPLWKDPAFYSRILFERARPSPSLSRSLLSRRPSSSVAPILSSSFTTTNDSSNHANHTSTRHLSSYFFPCVNCNTMAVDNRKKANNKGSNKNKPSKTAPPTTYPFGFNQPLMQQSPFLNANLFGASLFTPANSNNYRQATLFEPPALKSNNNNDMFKKPSFDYNHLFPSVCEDDLAKMTIYSQSLDNTVRSNSGEWPFSMFVIHF